MTDKAIIKALECHCHPVCCIDCPMHNREHDNCVTELWSLSLDLINRQQAEVETVNNRADMWHREAELNAAELIKMQAEIERLQAYKTLYEDLNAEYLETIACIKSIKAEAVKEFAKELKKEKYYGSNCMGYGTWAVELDDIDNLVKEMVGDAE